MNCCKCGNPLIGEFYHKVVDPLSYVFHKKCFIEQYPIYDNPVYLELFRFKIGSPQGVAVLR